MNLDIIETKENVLADNDVVAKSVRELCDEHHVFFINLMSSPGSGKTTTLERLITALKDQYRIGVMEADVDSDVDAKRVIEAGGKAIQLHTGGSCHMDADMTLRGLQAFGLDDIDILVLENVGNLVCPAEFDVGAHLKLMILSVPEGDDKPLKYPLMFTVSDCMLVNKIDVQEVFDFQYDKAVERAKSLNPNIASFAISSLKGDGFDAFVDWLKNRIEAYRHEGN